MSNKVIASHSFEGEEEDEQRERREARGAFFAPYDEWTSLLHIPLHHSYIKSVCSY